MQEHETLNVEHETQANESPTILKNWSNVYTALLIANLIYILAFLTFTRFFS